VIERRDLVLPVRFSPTEVLVAPMAKGPRYWRNRKRDGPPVMLF
jgi:hypothetical protein